MGGFDVGLEAEGVDVGRAIDEVPVHVCPHGVDRGEGREVGGGKGVEVGRRDLGGAVPAEELVVEEEAHFGDHEVASDYQGPEKVVGGVVLQLQHRHLRARQDDGLPQVLQHEAEGRTRVGQTVGSVQDHEGVEELVIPSDGPGNVGPAFGVDGTAVDEVLELEHGVAHLPVVRAHGRSEAGQALGPTGLHHDLERIGIGVVVEGWPRGHAAVQETPSLKTSYRLSSLPSSSAWVDGLTGTKPMSERVIEMVPPKSCRVSSSSNGRGEERAPPYQS